MAYNVKNDTQSPSYDENRALSIDVFMAVYDNLEEREYRREEVAKITALTLLDLLEKKTWK